MKYKGIIAISVLFLAQSFSMQSADDAAFEADLAAAMAASLETAQEERDRAFASASIKPGPRSQRSQTAESRYEPSVRPIRDLVAVSSLTATQVTKRIEFLEKLIGPQVAQIQREGSSSQVDLGLLQSQIVELANLLNQKITSYKKLLEDITQALEDCVGNQEETKRLNKEFIESDASRRF